MNGNAFAQAKQARPIPSLVDRFIAAAAGHGLRTRPARAAICAGKSSPPLNRKAWGWKNMTRPPPPWPIANTLPSCEKVLRHGIKGGKSALGLSQTSSGRTSAGRTTKWRTFSIRAHDEGGHPGGGPQVGGRQAVDLSGANVIHADLGKMALSNAKPSAANATRNGHTGGPRRRSLEKGAAALSEPRRQCCEYTHTHTIK
jgi:hypothetical protein